MAEDPRSLTERLVDASMEAKQTLQDLHIAAKDLRALIREYEQVARDAKNQIADIKSEFKHEIEVALEAAGPDFKAALDSMISKQSQKLDKVHKEVVDAVEGAIKVQKKSLDNEVASVMADLKRTMDISRTARELSEEGKLESIKVIDAAARTQEMTVKILEMMQILADHFAGGNIQDLQIEKDEETGHTRIITLHKTDPTEPNEKAVGE